MTTYVLSYNAEDSKNGVRTQHPGCALDLVRQLRQHPAFNMVAFIDKGGNKLAWEFQVKERRLIISTWEV